MQSSAIFPLVFFVFVLVWFVFCFGLVWSFFSSTFGLVRVYPRFRVDSLFSDAPKEQIVISSCFWEQKESFSRRHTQKSGRHGDLANSPSGRISVTLLKLQETIRPSSISKPSLCLDQLGALADPAPNLHQMEGDLQVSSQAEVLSSLDDKSMKPHGRNTLVEGHTL